MIGPTVRQLRQERNLSQEGLASTAHISSGYLSKLERGHYKEPSQEILSRIAGALQMTALELYRAGGIEHLLMPDDPALEPFIAKYAARLEELPKRDHDIILAEIKRIFIEESEGKA